MINTESNLPHQSLAATGGKYIPPGRRKQMLEEKKRQEAMAAQASVGAVAQSSQQDRRDYSRATNYRPSPSQNQNVADRWKSLDVDDNRYHDSRNTTSQRGPSCNDSPSPYVGNNRISQTGTRWDIRDNRRWRPESPDEVFKKDKGKSTGINFDKYDTIPVEMSGNNHQSIQPITSFRETRGIHPLLAENIVRVEYERPTPVQKNSIPVILKGRDLMACAQTGSGKTAAFLFPIITKMLNEGPPPDVVCTDKYRSKMAAYPVGLILSPTRELAIQIFEESRKFSFRIGIRTVVLYGGSEVRTQVYDLENGCDICVATPGRLSDLMKRGKVGLKLIKYFILDEADRMLDMGFSPQIYSIVEDYDMPTSKQGRQTVMFSATFPNPIQKLAAEFLHDYVFLTVGRVGSTNDFIQQHLIYADEDSKPKKLLKILENAQGKLVLVFVETKKKADLIEDFLLKCDLPAVTIHGDKSQQDRERALNQFRNKERTILVATDVAARGLDIHNIEHVINCDLPSRIDDYVHRIGRTGRAGNRGQATSFVNEGNRQMLRDLLGLLEEAQQEVPEWFYQMIRQCTSAYRSSNYSSGATVGGRSRGGGGNQRCPTAYGSRDIRSDRPTPAGLSNNNNNRLSNNRSSGHQEQNKKPAIMEEEEEDGW